LVSGRVCVSRAGPAHLSEDQVADLIEEIAMIMKKLTVGLTLAALFTLPGISVSANVPGVQPRLIPLTDFFK